MLSQYLNNPDIKFITDKNGKKKEVILPIEKYIELLEDLEDLKAINDRRNEATISHDDLKKELEASGLI